MSCLCHAVRAGSEPFSPSAAPSAQSRVVHSKANGRRDVLHIELRIVEEASSEEASSESESDSWAKPPGRKTAGRAAVGTDRLTEGLFELTVSQSVNLESEMVSSCSFCSSAIVLL